MTNENASPVVPGILGISSKWEGGRRARRDAGTVLRSRVGPDDDVSPGLIARRFGCDIAATHAFDVARRFRS